MLDQERVRDQRSRKQATQALFLADEEDLGSSQDEKLNWLIYLIENVENEFQVYKSLVCLKNLCRDWNYVKLLYKMDILRILKR